MKKSTKYKRRTVGGPWPTNTLLYLPQGGSIVFRLGKFLGRYNNEGVWEECTRKR